MSTEITPATGEHAAAPWAPPYEAANTQPNGHSAAAATPEAPTAALTTTSTAPAPPAPANYGVTYCSGCGSPINPRAAVCVNCGVATSMFAAQRPANPKVKSTAVVLVVLFGVFGWLYTYQRDSWKFWLNLGLTVVTLGLWGLVAWVWAIIDVSVRPSQFYGSFPNG